MPGFNIQGGGEANAKIESNRKHRWRFNLASIRNECLYLASAQRPHMITEEAVMHHDQEQVYFAGKHHWEPITLVFYDVYGSGGANTSSKIWDWVNESVKVAQASAGVPSAYKKDAKLEMTTADGGVQETWNIYNTWAIDTNWNDLDYSVSEIATIDVSMKYDRAKRG